MQNELFVDKTNIEAPLASRLRPRSLQEFIAQEDLIQKLSTVPLHSMLLYGPPGCGKTSLARILAEQAKLPFFNLSAISTGGKGSSRYYRKGAKSLQQSCKTRSPFFR